MTDTKVQNRLVSEWRESRLSATKFCEGRGFTSGQLRNWAYRLRRSEKRRAVQVHEPVRFARVVTAPKAPPVGSDEQAPTEPIAARQRPLLLMVAPGTRIAIRAGFCVATLVSVLDVLERRAVRGGKPS